MEKETTVSLNVEQHNSGNSNTLMQSLGICYTSIAKGRIEAQMPIDNRTMQPYGIMHGGASLALAETVAGLGSHLLCDADHYAVGMQVSANHISPATKADEYVYATATIIHQGQKTHVWNVDITVPSGRLISTIRVVNYVVEKHD